MVCSKCGEYFPCKIRINGKSHNLSNRKFCLDCSPFGLHNTRGIKTPTIGKRICPKCGKEKNDDEFYRRRTNNKLTSYCIDCNKKNATFYKQEIKKKCVDYKGGKCEICGYNKNLSALEFHHKNPDGKDFSIGNSKTIILENLKSELDKCVLLCANCHRELHNPLS
jgi:hypothetical protein